MLRQFSFVLVVGTTVGCAPLRPSKDPNAPNKCYTESGYLDSSNGCSVRRQMAMRRILLWITSITAFSMIWIISGCAVYEKCGVRGCPGDAEITAQVESLFKQHPDLEPPNMLTVRTLDRVVYLYGLVETDPQRQLAGDVASQAVGGTQVVNSIGVINR